MSLRSPIWPRAADLCADADTRRRHMSALVLGVPTWLVAGGLAAALVLVAARTSTDGRLGAAAAVLVGVTVSGVSAAFDWGPLGLASVALGLGLLAVADGFRRGAVHWVRSPLWLAAAVFLATLCISLTQALDVGAGMAVLFERGRDLVLLCAAVLLLAAVPRIRPVVVTAVLVVAALAGLTVVQEFVFGNSTEFGGLAHVPIAEDVGAATSRHAGPLEDVNFWGRLLLLTFPLALALGTGTDGRRWAWRGLAGVVAGGIYLTGSRGALIAAGVSAGVWLLLVRPRRRTLVLLAGAAAAVLAVPGVFTRLATLAAVGDAATAVADPSLRNRAAVQVVGLAMAEDHPVLGVGIGNFLRREPEYQRATGSFISEGVIAPHNLYLELLAETGVVGLFGWALLIGTAAFLAARALVTAQRLSSVEEAELSARLAAAVLVALAGWSVASLVLHLGNLSALLAVIALGAALDIRTRRALTAQDPLQAALVARMSTRRHGPRAAVLVPLAAAALLSGAGAIWLATTTPRFSATATAIVVPIDPGDAGQAYAYDVRSRDSLLPTYAALARSPGLTAAAAAQLGIDVSAAGVDVSAQARAPAAVVDVQVTSADMDVARQLASAVVEGVGSLLADADPLYRLQPEAGSVRVEPVSPPLGGPLPFAAALLLCGVAGAVEVRRGSRGRVARRVEPAAS